MTEKTVQETKTVPTTTPETTLSPRARKLLEASHQARSFGDEREADAHLDAIARLQKVENT